MSDKPEKKPMHNDGPNEPSFDYLKRAEEANDSGDFLLSMYLYLAAFQKSFGMGGEPSDAAIFGLKQAWAIACANKERQLAEYIFELMEPYLNSTEVEMCADQLQNLTLDKLEEFGLTREDLEDMAQMITDDIIGDVGPMVKLDGIGVKRLSLGSGKVSASDKAKETNGCADDSASGDGDQADLAAIEGEVREAFTSEGEVLDYERIVGYDSAIEAMRQFGVGMKDDPKFQEFVGMLNARHGLDRRPAPDSLLFRSHAREDANRFMLATLGELDLPSVHMRMEENFQGMPVLCISARAIDIPSPSSLGSVFQSGGVLILEDIDLWESPSMDVPEDGSSFFLMQMTRGAREAVNLIRNAVDNPEVYVIATSSIEGPIDDFFLDLLEPLYLIDIDYPTEEERSLIWMDIAKEHPSIRSINRRDLVKYSANLPRYDIYMAAREAIEEAYKVGLMTRRYHPVSRDNIFDKLAAYQPLDSNEYTELEDEVVRDFQSDLSHIDDLLGDV